MDMLLEGKVAVVTGGSSGNGRAISEGFVAQGAKVIVADLRPEGREGGTPTAEAMNAIHPGCAKFVTCDVSRIADLEALVDEAEAWGGLDIMVNNAGILQKEPFLEAKEATYQRMQDVNVKSVFFGSQMAARAMVKRKKRCDHQYVLDRWYARDGRLLSLQHVQRRGSAADVFVGR
jgi:NAD(P)-dependent dehydrogenase (short-subunit alcohol dehydrogenase family)